MSIIGDFIKVKRDDKGLSQRELARLCGVNNAEISRIESGERQKVSPAILRSLAPVLGVSYENLMSKAGYLEASSIDSFVMENVEKIKIINEEISTLGFQKLYLTEELKSELDKERGKEIQSEIEELSVKINNLAYEKVTLTKENAELKILKSSLDIVNNYNNFNFIQIPVLSIVKPGQPILSRENLEGYYPTDKQFISVDRDYFYLRIKDDSMDKEFKENSLVLVQQQNYIESGQIGVVLIDGFDDTVKRVFVKDNLITLMPQSNNPEHQPQIYDMLRDEVQILGKVTLAIKKL